MSFKYGRTKSKVGQNIKTINRVNRRAVSPNRVQQIGYSDESWAVYQGNSRSFLTSSYEPITGGRSMSAA